MPENKPLFSSDFTLGMLGGGQLGKMLLAETQRYDIKTSVMDPSADAPCKTGSTSFTNGSITDYQSVVDFGAQCDLLTIEIENVNTEALKELQRQGKKVYPKPETLDIIRDKTLQKNFYQEQGIPTAPFDVFTSKSELIELSKKPDWSLPFVWKSATGGYDGRGVSIIREEKDLDALPDANGLLEKLIPFKKEVAVIVARNASGNSTSYPMVEMDFHPTANLVEYVFSPSPLPENTQNEAGRLARSIADKMDHVGLLAVEMFLTHDDELLVNEVAPRVHNSGHLSIEGNITSQFEQHLRAILDLPLGSTETVRPAVMVNLVGEEGYTGKVLYKGIEDIIKLPGVYVHLYGKTETRPFRKMGHVTITGNTLEEAREKARNVKSLIKVISV